MKYTTQRWRGLIGVAAGVAATLVATTALRAQQQEIRNGARVEGPTTVAAYAGAWALDQDPRLRAALSIDHYMGEFVARAALSAVVSRRTQCVPAMRIDCDRRLVGLGGTVGARLIDRGGRTHPYIGAGGGPFLFDDDGAALFYAEAGLRRDLGHQWGIDLRGAFDEIMFADLADPLREGRGTSLSIGVWHALR